MKKYFLVLLITLLVKLSIAQITIPNLQNFGKPFVKPNIVNLNITVPSSINCNDQTAILIDLGELNSTGNTVNCFKVLFVDFPSGVCQSITIKDKTEANEIINSIGVPNVWTFGKDGNIYLGTKNGGHIVRINYQKRKAEDLGIPINEFANTSITALSLGTDLTITGAIQYENLGSQIFSYNYNCEFKVLTSQIIDANFQTVSEISNDAYCSFAKCINNLGATKLYCINNETLTITDITSSTNNMLSNYKLVAYLGDYVYSVANQNSTSLYSRLDCNHTGFLSVSSYIPSIERIKCSDTWKNLYTNYSNSITSFDETNWSLYYNTGSVDGNINLSNCIQTYSKPTKALAPYYNPVSGMHELFIHGSTTPQASSFDYLNNSFNYLGLNPNGGVYSAIVDFDDRNIFLGPIAAIQKYEATSTWDNSGNNPQVIASTYYNNNLQNNWLFSAGEMKKLNNKNLLVVAGTNGSSRSNTQAPGDETSLLIINPTNGYSINDVYIPQFSQFYAIHKSMGIDQKNEAIIIVGNNQNTNAGLNFAHLMVLNPDGALQLEYDIKDQDDKPIYGVTNIVVYNDILFFFSGNILYRIVDFYNKNARAEVVFKSTYSGSFCALGLSNNNQYLTAGVSDGWGNVQLYIIPIHEVDRTYPNNMGEIIAINGIIPNANGEYVYEFAFVDDYCFLSGHSSLYGFQFADFGLGTYSEKAVFANKKGISTTSKKTILVAPNPTSENINAIYTTTENENIVIQIFDSRGVSIYSKEEKVVMGKNRVSIKLNTLPASNYIIKAITKKETIFAKFIKQ